MGNESIEKLNRIGLVAACIKGNTGAGFLFQPCAWKAGGYVLTTLWFPIIGGAAIFCALRLIRVRRLTNSTSYGDMMFVALGRPGTVAINTSIFLLQCGSCCSYLAL